MLGKGKLQLGGTGTVGVGADIAGGLYPPEDPGEAIDPDALGAEPALGAVPGVDAPDPWGALNPDVCVGIPGPTPGVVEPPPDAEPTDPDEPSSADIPAEPSAPDSLDVMGGRGATAPPQPAETREKAKGIQPSQSGRSVSIALMEARIVRNTRGAISRTSGTPCVPR
jgi:hypothetical protein